MTINLLPWRQQQARRQLQYSYLILTCVLLCLCYLALQLQQVINHNLQRTQQQLMQLTQQRQHSDKQLTHQQCDIIDTINQQTTNLLQHITQQIALTQLLTQLPQTIPPSAYLTSLAISNSHLSLHGNAAAATMANLLLEQLTQITALNQIQLTSINKTPLSQTSAVDFSFVVQAHINPTAPPQKT